MEPVQSARVFSNRYELTHLIARGGMAQVFRARDRLLDRPVAVKVLFPELSVDLAFVERFRREAQAAANLSHPNIVPVFDWGEDGGTYFIVMELVDGQPLSAVLRASGALPAPQVADIGSHVAAALAFAHRNHVIHRDVKPGNVLITPEGQVKVTDFGIARATNTEESLTQTGAVMGTATYFSPEQAEGYGVDVRSDIYSLGVVLYEMVAGRPPFLGETPVAVASKHVRDQPPPLRALAPSVPPALEAVIMKAMAKDPNHRYSTATDLRSDLLRFAEGLPVSAGDPAATQVESAVTSTGVQSAIGHTHAVPLVEPFRHFDQHEFDGGGGKQTKRLATILIVLVVVLLLVGFFLLRSLGYVGGVTKFSMPNVIGQLASTAAAHLENHTLIVGANRSEQSAKISAGRVITTDPVPGHQVQKNENVNLVVSSGAPPVKHVSVPNVKGETLSQAEAKLRQDKLTIGTVKTVASQRPQNTVLTQTPKPTKSVPVGTKVTLTVPAVSTTITVPAVAGDTTEQAAAQVGAKGLQAGTVTQACSTSFGNGLVISTNPIAGTQVQKDTPVAFTVSTGHCQGIVPGVVGTSAPAAESKLSGAGFTDVHSSTTSSCKQTENGHVVSQTPAAGITSATSAPVSIGVCSAQTSTTKTPTSPPVTSTTTTTTNPTTPLGPGSTKSTPPKK